MTKLEALKRMYLALGGDSGDIKNIFTIAEMIDICAQWWEEHGGGGGGGSVVVDDHMSETSKNPVQNKVITAAMSEKVDKVDGKTLSTNDYTTAEKNKLASLYNYDDTAISQALTNKVDKVAGKGLSSEDFTTEDKEKLDNVKTYTAGTGINISEDGEISATGVIAVDDELSDVSENPVQNKVVKGAIDGKVDKTEGKTLSSNDFTDEEKEKLSTLSNDITTVTDTTNDKSYNMSFRLVDGKPCVVYEEI